MNSRVLQILWVSIFLSASPVAAQVTLIVDDDGQGTPASCDASTPAFATVSSAIGAAGGGDTVLVCPGTYVENIDFAGKGITVRSAAGPAVTILDGNATGSVVTFVAGETGSSVLEGFTIRNGLASHEGGGIRIAGASPVVRGNVVMDNKGCAGTGISILFASPLVEENTITQNTQAGCSGGTGGGGILIQGSGAGIIRRNVITNNITAANGGGLSLFAAGAPIIEFNVVSGNSASEGGGFWLVNQSDASISGNMIVRNHASSSGGGVYWGVPAGTRGPVLVNNTIAENDSVQGAGIFAAGYDAGVVVSNNIIAAPGSQTAVFCSDVNDLNPPVFRSNNVYSPSGLRYGGICADQTGVNGNISSGPAFLNPASGDYHLMPSTPGVDAGDNAALGLTATDIDLHGRILDGNGDSVAIVDMGAYEAEPYSPLDLPGAFARSSPANGAPGQQTALSLTWTPSIGATSYEYCYDTVDNGTCDGTWTPAWAGTSATVVGLESQTTYYWQVRANNAAGATYATGNMSAYWSFTTRLTEPKPFVKIGPWNGAQNQQTTLALNWEASALATSYEYCYDTSNNDTCDGIWVSAGNATNATISGLLGYTMYFWQVRAIDAAGETYANGSTAAFWRFTTDMAPPEVFGKTSPMNGAQAPTTVSLSWRASPGATHYEYCIDLSDNGSCDWGWTWIANTTSATLTGLSARTTYYWQVRAVNTGGATDADGSTSAFWSFSTGLASPGWFGKSGPPNGSGERPTTVALTWYASPGATAYEYCLDTVNNATCDGAWVGVGNNTVATVSALTPGTTYYWQVRAVNSDGEANADAGVWWGFGTEGVFKPVGIVDFDGDGRQDLVWRHSATGRNAVWSIDGARLLQSRALSPAVADTNWQIVATADFNGDARPDLLWRNDDTGQNVVWYMNGTTFLSQAMLPAVPDVRWRIVAAGDFNADAKPDLVWRNDTTGQNVVWYMNGTNFMSQTLLPPITDTRWGIVAAGDFNGDGRPDLAWRNDVTGQNVVWYMDGATFVSQALLPPRADTAWHIGLVGDVNRDGRVDIVWRSDATGENAVWYLDGVRLSSQAALPAVTDTRWDLAGPRRRPPAVPSDFNRDGQPDLLWRNIATGQSAVWFMSGTGVAAVRAVLPTVPDTGWQVAAVADFTGDGKPDLLWRNPDAGQNVVWHMDGLTFVSQTVLPPVPHREWQIVAATEVNGDGSPDIVWRNRSTGENVVWYMSGVAFLSQALLPTLADTSWLIAGAGDLDGDRHPDLVWRNRVTGENLVWYMNGTTAVSTGVLPTVPDPNGQIGLVADFDGDCQAELVWRNTATGENVVQYLSGPRATTVAALPTVSDADWVIVRDPRSLFKGSFALAVTAGSGPIGTPISVTATPGLGAPAIATYRWDFGDGSAPVVTAVPNAVHIYASIPAGFARFSFLITVTATGADGRIGFGSATAVITP